jgi:hypothetical protein
LVVKESKPSRGIDSRKTLNFVPGVLQGPFSLQPVVIQGE